MNQEFYTIEEAAEILKVTTRTIYSYIEAGKIQSYKIGKHHRVKPTDLDMFINACKKGFKNEDSKIEENPYYHNDELVFSKGRLEKEKPIVVEFFCGCGGTSLGFEMAGYEVALGVDIHKPSIETFKRNHPNAFTILGDINKLKVDEVKNILRGKRIDVLIGGIPCQGFSLNNKKRNQNDARNFLYLELLRFVKGLNPKSVVIENVSGMKSTANGEFIKKIKKVIEKYNGYKLQHRILSAADYGVPQKRERLVFVGLAKDIEGDFDFDKIVKTHGTGTGRAFVTIKEAIADLPPLQSGEEVKKYETKPKYEYQKLMRKGVSSNILENHKAPNHPVSVINRISKTKPGFPMYPKYKQRIRLDWEDLSPTQVSGGIRPQFQFGHPRDKRGLTIRERCRIQSFPDSFVIEGGLTQGRVQTGNAVPPLLARAVAKALLTYLK